MEESVVGVGRDWAKAPKSILSQPVERSSHYRSFVILLKLSILSFSSNHCIILSFLSLFSLSSNYCYIETPFELSWSSFSSTSSSDQQPILHAGLIQFTLRLPSNLSDRQSSSVSYIDNKADMLELMSWCFQSSLNRFGQFTTGWLDHRPPTRRLLETNKRVWSPPP